MLPTAMPETAMYQDHHAETYKPNVNEDSRHPLVRAVTDTVPSKCCVQFPFRSSVTAPDSRHYVAAFGSGPDVGHELAKIIDRLRACPEVPFPTTSLTGDVVSMILLHCDNKALT